MATIDLMPRGTKAAASARLPMDEGGVARLKYILDVNRLLDQDGQAIAASDVLQVIRIPNNAIILGEHHEVIRASTTSTPTVDIGITGTATLFVSNLDTSATGGSTPFVTATAVAAGSEVIITCDTLQADLILKVEVLVAAFAGDEDYMSGNWGV